MNYAVGIMDQNQKKKKNFYRCMIGMGGNWGQVWTVQEGMIEAK